MVLLLRLIPDVRCIGCAAFGFCCDKTLLCPQCLGQKFGYEQLLSRRRPKPAKTVSEKFAHLWPKVIEFRKAFGG